MSELLLNSLEIKGYRCFEHLTVEKLGRVNLVVGKNNVGKTAFLEAFWIYAESHSWKRLLGTLRSLLERRKEKDISEPMKTANGFGTIIDLQENVGTFFRHLFNNRPKNDNSEFSLTSDKPLSSFLAKGLNIKDSVRVRFDFKNDTGLIYSSNLDESSFHEEIANLFINSTGLETNLLTEIWDDVILKNEEDNAVNALRIIAPEVLDLNFINYPKGSNSRVPVVRTRNIDERVPLSSLGEGMSRLLGIALALVSCKNGMLIIDEIESGLHYSILPDVWKLIFKTAKDLNVQVFATTHSKDCVEAFTEAAAESPEDGILIRLERQGENIVAKTIEEERLELAMAHDVEVR